MDRLELSPVCDFLRIERKAVIGAAWQLEEALHHSEDSSKPKHIIHRTADLHDLKEPSRSFSAEDLSGAMERAPQEST